MASTCPRCGRLADVPVLPTGSLCALCGPFVLVRELGEMIEPSERADPDEWGSASL